MRTPIIDTHAHIYPTKIAAKAVANVGKFYGIEMTSKEGTAEKLLSLAAPYNVQHIVIHSVATVPHQVESINNFISEEARQNSIFVPFATLHPDMSGTEIKAELERISTLGMRGIKLHPDCQQFHINGKRGMRLLENLDGSIPILYHTGDKRKDFSNPTKMIEVAKAFPHLTFIAAHFGGYSEWEHSDGYAGLQNVYFDTSSTLAFLGKARALELINELGVERFMFGTDYPMWDYKSELDKFFALELDRENEEKILYNNAKKLLKL